MNSFSLYVADIVSALLDAAECIAIVNARSCDQQETRINGLTIFACMIYNEKGSDELATLTVFYKETVFNRSFCGAECCGIRPVPLP